MRFAEMPLRAIEANLGPLLPEPREAMKEEAEKPDE